MLLLLISHSVMYNSLWLRGLQHARLPCPALSHGVCSNSCPLSWWCHPDISSSVILFSSLLQSFPASGSFPVSWFFASGDQSIGASVSASVLPVNSHRWFSSGWTGLISLLTKDSQESSPAPQFESINSSALSFLYGPTLTSIHDYWKNHSFDYMNFNPEYSLEGLMPKLKFQYFGHLKRRTDSFEKTLMLGEIEVQRRKACQRMRWLDSITDSMEDRKSVV